MLICPHQIASLLAGLATPLVVSVHSVVSSDFAAALLPGWHSTIFPPYFVAGAIFSGMAMVLTLMLVVRKVLHLEDYLTPRHIDVMADALLPVRRARRPQGDQYELVGYAVWRAER